MLVIPKVHFVVHCILKMFLQVITLNVNACYNVANLYIANSLLLPLSFT
jgi:hypothetical protein